jgi:hypothetical protein
LQIPVSAATPESKKTFASTTPANSNFSLVKSSPHMATLRPTPSRNKNDPAKNAYAKSSHNFQTVGTGKQATTIRTVPSTVKYRQLALIEYKGVVNKHEGVIPTGSFYADAPPHEHILLWIKAVAHADKLSELQSDDDESDISFAAVGHHFIDSIGLFEKYHIAIYTQAFLDIKPTDLPKTVSAFSFEINPVNHPNFIIFSLAYGIEPQWWERLDHIGLRWLMDDVYSNFKPDAQGRQLPKSLELWINRGETWTTNLLKKFCEGWRQWGKNIAVAYAPTVKGFEVAID